MTTISKDAKLVTFINVFSVTAERPFREAATAESRRRRGSQLRVHRPPDGGWADVKLCAGVCPTGCPAKVCPPGCPKDGSWLTEIEQRRFSTNLSARFRLDTSYTA